MFTKEFKLAAVQRLEQGVSLGEVARALEVNANVPHRWRREIRQGPGNVFPGHGKQRWSEGRIAELERKIGQQALEIDFLKGCLQRIEEWRMLQAGTGNPRGLPEGPRRSEGQSRTDYERMVELGRVSRSGFYRFEDGESGPDRDLELSAQTWSGPDLPSPP
jgi:transposase